MRFLVILGQVVLFTPPEMDDPTESTDTTAPESSSKMLLFETNIISAWCIQKLKRGA